MADVLRNHVSLCGLHRLVCVCLMIFWFVCVFDDRLVCVSV